MPSVRHCFASHTKDFAVFLFLDTFHIQGHSQPRKGTVGGVSTLKRMLVALQNMRNCLQGSSDQQMHGTDTWITTAPLDEAEVL